MSKFFSPLKVGMLVLLSGFSFVYFSANLKKNMKEDGNYIINAYLNDATGLSKRSRIFMSGITVGEIKDIQLSENLDKAKITLIMKRKIKLRSDATILKKSASILGDSYIEITPGYKGIILKDGDTITKTVEAASMGNVMTKFDDIAGDVRDMTKELKNILADPTTTNSMKNTLGKLEEIMTKFDKMVELNNQKITSIVTNIEVFTKGMQNMPKEYNNKITKLIDNVDQTVVIMKDMLKENKDHMSSILKSTNKLIKETSIVTVNETLENVKKISDDITKISDDLSKGKGTIGALLKSDKLYNQIDEAVDTATGFLSNFSTLKTIVDANSVFLLKNGAGYHTFGIKFQPKPDKFYYMGVTSSPFGVLTEDKVTIVDGEETTIKTYEQELSLTLLMAFKFYFLTFKYGIFESSAGVGIDFSLFHNSLEFTTRLNEFSNTAPNLKLAIKYYPVKYLYLNVGTLYALHPNNRDFYFGFGASFDDKDLKSILTVMPIPSL